MRYLSVDRGDKRTGLALGDDQTAITTPLDVVISASRAEQLRQILAVVRDEQPDALIVGVPLNMDGTVGPGARKAIDFAGQLQTQAGLPVKLFDERLSSRDADAQMAQTGLTHKQKKLRRDALAAANILRGFLERPDECLPWPETDKPDAG